MKLTQELVRKLLDYDPDTGALTWKMRPREGFVSDRACNTWNARFAGKPAFTARSNTGYLAGAIFYKTYLSHRIIWLWMTGVWPKDQIDHQNRNRVDNRWDNLCEATNHQNSRNHSLNRNNTTGHIGVYRHGSGFSARIKIDGSVICLGTFPTLEEAAVVRCVAQKRYGFSLGHGQAKPIVPIDDTDQ